MKVLSVEELTKTYGDKTLFHNISFSISENDKMGLIGTNGTGKTTLLKIIAGIESADSGLIDHPKDYKIAYLSQNPSFNDDSTVLEQIFYGNSEEMKLFREYEIALQNLQQDPENIEKQNYLFSIQQRMDMLNAWDANTKAKTILNKLGISDYQKNIKELSGGQQKRVALARAFIQPADLLILDEPTNHIDNETIEWLEEYLGRFTGSILLVTHDRYFLNRVTNKIIELNNGNIYSYEGNYEYFLEKKASREEEEESREFKRKNILRRELEWLKRGAKARTTKQKARIQRVHELESQETDSTSNTLEISLKTKRLGKKIIEIENLSKSYGERTLIKDFSFQVLPNDRIGIIGPNGAGKTSLLKLLMGILEPNSGTIDVGQTVRFGYYTQINEEMNDEVRVIDYIKEAGEIVHTTDHKTITASQMLERFLFTPEMQWTYIKKLSGGEKRRLYLLKILMSEPNVLLLDEPTNDLDIQTLSILEDYIDHYPGVVITVSHDRYFLDRTAEKLLAFYGDGDINLYYGAYTEYLHEKKAEQFNKPNDHQEIKPTKNEKKTNQKKKLSYKEQQEWNEIENNISNLEQRLQEIQANISNAGSNYEEAEKLYIEQKQLESEYNALLERWTELSELIEEIEQTKTP